MIISKWLIRCVTDMDYAFLPQILFYRHRNIGRTIIREQSRKMWTKRISYPGNPMAASAVTLPFLTWHRNEQIYIYIIYYPLNSPPELSFFSIPSCRFDLILIVCSRPIHTLSLKKGVSHAEMSSIHSVSRIGVWWDFFPDFLRDRPVRWAHPAGFCRSPQRGTLLIWDFVIERSRTGHRRSQYGTAHRWVYLMVHTYGTRFFFSFRKVPGTNQSAEVWTR